MLALLISQLQKVEGSEGKGDAGRSSAQGTERRRAQESLVCLLYGPCAIAKKILSTQVEYRVLKGTVRDATFGWYYNQSRNSTTAV